MKKSIFILIVVLSVSISCSKRGRKRGDACISPSQTTLTINSNLVISNCGDEIPSDYVETSLDWGDGTITDGQTGTHSYSTVGVYTVRLLLNGDWAADVQDIEPSKVELTITVQ
ncbi:MAG: PKD domain-containing protein [Fluviicola sp.]|nr:PKD domain-containing protein [Fluviicola sp.]